MKLNTKRTILLGLAFLAISAFWQMYDNIIPLILSDTFGQSDTMIGIVMAADNVLALFLLPLIGLYSDKVNTKIGKRMPFIIVGTVVAVISMMFIPFAQSINSLPLFIVVLAITLLAMASYRSPAVALMPDLTPKPLRSKGNAVVNLMGAVGGVVALVLIAVLTPQGDSPVYTLLFIGIAFVMLVSMIVLVLTTKENQLAIQIEKEYGKEDDSNVIVDESGKIDKKVFKSLAFLLMSVFLWFMAYNAVTTAFSRYAVGVWGMTDGSYTSVLMVATVAAILCYIPIGIITSKIGRKKCILAGLLIMFSGYLGVGLMPSFNFIINIFFAFVGIGWATVSVNSLPMVVEMSKGSDVGRYTGLYYTFSMAAQIITPIFSGILLDNFSYGILFPYCLIFTALSAVTMIFVVHGDSKPEQKGSVLENFDVED